MYDTKYDTFVRTRDRKIIKRDILENDNNFYSSSSSDVNPESLASFNARSSSES